MSGKTKWFFPDAELPPKGPDGELYGHESIIVLNPNRETAVVRVTLYWTDRPPDRGEVIHVEGERVVCRRIVSGWPQGGLAVPEGEQYAIGLESDLPVVAQYGRLDVRQSNMAFYTTPGYAE